MITVQQVMERVDVDCTDELLIRKAIWSTDGVMAETVALLNSSTPWAAVAYAEAERKRVLAHEQEQRKVDDVERKYDLAITVAADHSGYNINDVQRLFLKTLLKELLE